MGLYELTEGDGFDGKRGVVVEGGPARPQLGRRGEGRGGGRCRCSYRSHLYPISHGEAHTQETSLGFCTAGNSYEYFFGTLPCFSFRVGEVGKRTRVRSKQVRSAAAATTARGTSTGTKDVGESRKQRRVVRVSRLISPPHIVSTPTSFGHCFSRQPRRVIWICITQPLVATLFALHGRPARAALHPPRLAIFRFRAPKASPRHTRHAS